MGTMGFVIVDYLLEANPLHLQIYHRMMQPLALGSPCRLERRRCRFTTQR